MGLADDLADRVRDDFPVLAQKVNGRPLVYLDNGATTQVPDQVLDAVVHHYHTNNANVHRGIHTLSERSTAALEEARRKVGEWVNTAEAAEVVFTKGTTDAINIMARSLGDSGLVGAGDVVAVTKLEHHGNLVPWQQLCRRTGAKLEFVALDEALDVDLGMLEGLLESGNVKVVATTHVSNVTGTVVPVADIAALSHEAGALSIVDAAQSIRHEAVDVQAIGCDALCFSGHKICAPTGIGALWCKHDLLERLAPVEFGGEMVDIVTMEEATFEDPPIRFEAGTPNYVGAVALGAALDYLDSIGREAVSDAEHELLDYAEKALADIGGLTVLGAPAHRAGCLSFVLEGAHPFDVATLLDAQGVAVRSGNQCAQPLLHEVCDVLNVTRLSPAFYNTFAEIDACVAAIGRVAEMLGAFSQ